MKKVFDLLFSTKLMSVMVVLFAIAMAVATFVENDFGTQSSKALIYNSWWFEAIMFLLMINFIGNIFRYRLYRKEKWPVFLFHIAFIVTLIGAFVTRYFGYEGTMHIRENDSSNIILSDKMFVQATVDNGKEQKYYEEEVLFGVLSRNNFSINSKFREVPFEIEYIDYIPNAKLEFTASEKGKEHVHLIIANGSGSQEIYVPDQGSVEVENHIFTFNKPVKGGMNFIKTENGLTLQPSETGTYMEMQSQETTTVLQDSISQAQFLKLYSFPTTQFVIKENILKGEKKYVPSTKEEKDMYPKDALYVNITSGKQTEQTVLLGFKDGISEPNIFTLNGLNFKLIYGPKTIQIPFSVKLRDFQMGRYPGTNSPSSYASEVTVIDKDKSFDYRIYMNHVLDYKGYRFFQSFYDQDEQGSILSVNHDYVGTLITYFGYFLMSLGMFITLFWKGSRFSDLSKKLSNLNKEKVGILILLFSLSLNLSAQNAPQDTVMNDTVIHSENDGHNHNTHDNTAAISNPISKEHAAKYGRLLVQDHQGRIKPINTYALEALRKIYKKDSFEDLTAEQVILSMQLDPYYWAEKYLIHVKENTLGKKISSDIQVKDGNVALSKLYGSGSYYFSEPLQKAMIKKSIDRNATDKEIINLDERVNVLVSIFGGNLIQIYPKEGDKNNKWYAGFDQDLLKANDTAIALMHENYLISLINASKTGDYTEADKNLDEISKYQLKYGAEIIPSARKIDLEIKYNQWNVFKKLMMYYMLVGFVFLILAFIDLFKPDSKLVKGLLKLFTGLTLLGLLLHAIGLGVRWYISGHAPWSNGYEAVVFVAFVSILAGVIFSHKKSKFALAATVIFASLLLGIAHGSTMNPEITNLVPVLKSYWLMIHVAIITASYGFLGLGALLGFVVLFLYILRTPHNNERINKTIDELSYVNESTITVGLFTLSIGTFLGGVWASESWGRYWSWDPKEVWSLISMMVYVFVLHMRLVPGLRGKFAFNLASLFSISTLIMTFFGVNFYLSGMHSYATGDPVPIPIWIYFAIAFFVIFAIVSYWRYRKLE